MRNRVTYTTICLFLLVSGISYSQVSQNQQPTSSNWDKTMYENKDLFNQLSGAGQIRLERQFGSIGNTAKSAQIPDAYLNESINSFSSSITNVLVNDTAEDTTTQDTQSETAIVTGAGSSIIAGFNDSGSYLGGASKFTGYSLSTDGGITFKDKGTFPTSVGGDAGDPVLARDTTTGTIYFSTLCFTSSCQLQVFRSYDNGSSFVIGVNSAPGFIEGTDSQDKEWITVDNFPGTGRGNVYQAWRNFSSTGSKAGITFTRSTDGGATYIPSPGMVLALQGSYNVQGASVVVGPDHAVYVFWYDQSAGSGTAPYIKMRKSTDYGVTFGSAVIVANLVETATNGDLGLEFRTNTFPQAAVNPVNGNLYVVFNDKGSGGDRCDVFFVQSTTSGTSWTTPVKVNDDSSGRDQYMPAIAVRPDGTGLCMTWYDRRNDPSNVLIDRYGAIASVTGNSVVFGQNFRITDQSFPVVVGVDPVINTTYMGDYDQMAADNNYYYTTWGDNRNMSLAASRHQADARFAKIPVTGPPPSPALSLTSTAIFGGNGNGVIDENECVELNVVLQNSGNDTAINILGTLTLLSSISGVSVSQNLSSYSDMTPGGVGVNLSPYTLSISPSFACGSKISLVMSVTTNNGYSASIPFQLLSGNYSQITVVSTSTPVAIPDNNTSGVSSPITVSGFTTAIGNVVVSVYITHTYDGDLILSLIGPDSTTVLLSNRRGGSGHNYGGSCGNPTIFDSNGTVPISNGTAAFIGTYIPESSLFVFTGKSGSAVNGTWNLHVADVASADTGIIWCWSLSLYSPFTCVDGGGVCGSLPPSAAFYGNPTSGLSPLSVLFTDTTLHNPTMWNWSFGDGSTSNLQNPNHQYVSNTDAVFTVQLIASNSLGTSTTIKVNYIHVSHPLLPNAGFYADTTTGGTPLLVNFTDTSNNNPTGWHWSFGDGSTSTSQNPSHQYTTTTVANFTVQLIVTNSVGTSTSTHIGYIHVLPPPPPSAGFFAIPVVGVSPLLVNFTDTSGNSPTAWNWSFGDGSTSALQSPVHSYYASTSTVTYNVTLVASNAFGTSTVTKSNFITVIPAPVILVQPNSFNKTIPQGTIAYDMMTIWNTSANGTTLVWSITESVSSTLDLPLQVGDDDSGVDQLPKNPKDVNPNVFTGSLSTTQYQSTPSNADNAWQYQNGLTNARYRATAATVNGKIYVIGGYDSGGVAFSSVEMYDPQSNTWSSKSSMPLVAANMPCGVIGNKIYVPAGYNATYSYLSILQIYDTQFDTWTTGASMPIADSGAAAAVVNGKLYVMGGSNASATEMNTCYVYDPVGDSWSQISSMNYARGYLGAAVVNNKIYAVGGWDPSNLNVPYCEEYDPVNNIWSVKSSMNLARGDLGACSDGYYVYAIGGGGIWTNFTTLVERYNPIEDTWDMDSDIVPTLNNARNALSVAVNNYTLYAIGGYNGSAMTTNEILTVDVLGWLDENPKAGSSNGGQFSLVTVTFDATGLLPGSTTGWFGIVNNDPNNNPVMIPVTLTVSTLTGNPPIANFYGIPTTGISPLQVNFYDLSTNNPTSWAWDFGDGITTGFTLTSTTTHVYGTVSTTTLYTVQLIVTNAFGTSTSTRNNYIIVLPSVPVEDWMLYSEERDIPQIYMRRE